MTIVEQISTLLSKIQYIARNYRKTCYALYVSTVNYTSYHGEKEGANDVHTKIILTDYAYQKLFVEATKKIVFTA